MKKLMYVLMGNDYPEGVFDDEILAEIECDRRSKASDNQRKLGGKRIYWRVYKFELNETGRKF